MAVLVSNDEQLCDAMRKEAGTRIHIVRVNFTDATSDRLTRLQPGANASLLLDLSDPEDAVTLTRCARNQGWVNVIVIGADRYRAAYSALQLGGANSYWPKSYDPKIIRTSLDRDL